MAFGTQAFTLGAMLLVACDASTGAATRDTPPRENATPSASAAPTKPARYLERVTGGANPHESLPLVVALHGLGDTPEAFGELYAGFDGKARILLLGAPDAFGGGYSWFPFRPEASDEERAREISRAAERLAPMLPSLAAARPTRGKPILTGFSQGGMLSFAIAARHPELVACALPIGGVLPEALWPPLDPKVRHPRIVALHGEDDTRVPIAPTRAGITALTARGYDARLEAFPGVGHQIPAAMRARYFELLHEAIGAS